MGYTHRFIFGIENGTTTDPLTRCEVPVIHADVIVEAGKGSYLPPGNAYDCVIAIDSHPFMCLRIIFLHMQIPFT